MSAAAAQNSFAAATSEINFADDALDLYVPGMPDDDYAKPPRGEVARRLVNPLDKGAGRVDDADPPCLRSLTHLRGDAMRRKEHCRAVRNLVETLDKCESALFKLFDDNLVVDEFVKAVEGSA